MNRDRDINKYTDTERDSDTNIGMDMPHRNFSDGSLRTETPCREGSDTQ
jgi:hypothetical protein